MEESTRPEPSLRQPGSPGGDGVATAAPTPLGPAHLADPRALTILTTEHWGLLTARSLVYNEAFSRAGMFLTFLSASLVALGFVYQGAGSDFPMIASAVLALDLVVGIATLGRLVRASTEEFFALQGMARLRHAYLEMVPSLGPYLSTSPHDDIVGILSAYGATPGNPSAPRSVLHGLTTVIGMVAMIDAVIVAALVAMIAVDFGLEARGALAVGLVTALVFMVVGFGAQTRAFLGAERRLEVRFPTPPEDGP